MIARPLAVAAALGGLALLGAACRVDLDLGEEVTRTFEVTEFDEIEIDSAFDVIIETGEEPSLVVELHEEVEDRLEVDQDGNRLRIGLGGGLFSTTGDLDVRITTPDLSLLDLDGAVSADIIDLDTDRLVLELDGASTVSGRGSVGVLVIDADGASTVDFGRVDVERAELDVDGASSIDVSGAAEVTGEADGASSIDIADGTPHSVDVNGASSID
jgi:hypothetical protein